MNYKIIDKGRYLLHFINTDRFKTTLVRVNFRGSLEKHEITFRNVLLDMLTYSTEHYPTKKELVAKTQDLYALSIYARANRIGKFASMNFFLSFLNEKYTEKGMEDESLKLLSEVIFHPHVKNGKFDSDSFKIIKKNNEVSIQTMKDNPARYSMIRLLENIDEDAPFAHRQYGYLDDLEKINEKNLYEYYQKVLTTNSVDIYIIGNFDEKQMEEKIERYFPFQNTVPKENDYIFEHQEFPKKIRTIVEKEKFSQSKLSIGCKIHTMTERERNYVVTIYNILLGGSADSKFFKNIREKHSICYYIDSSVNKLDNLLLIRSGIDRENFEKCLELIQKEMKDMEEGKFDEEDLEKAKSTYITLLDEVYDNKEAIIESYVAKDLLNIGDIEERKKEIMSIQKEEIVEVSKKIVMDTVYLLEGEEENEEV